MVLRYIRQSFLADIKAGFITAVVALPLAIGFAIASGVEPIMGLYTAIIAGFLGSLMGGSSFSITGPTGAMTVIILSTVHKFGIEGLFLAGLIAGVFQMLFGAIRLGKLVKFIPLPIVSGFTAGIGLLIFIGQIPNALGLAIPAQEYAWQTLVEVVKHAPAANIAVMTVTLGTIIILVGAPFLLRKNKYTAAIPPSIIALVISVIGTLWLGWNVPQVGTIPSGLPEFHRVAFSLELIHEVLPAALTIALLGAIESLLCAVVCDGMTGTKHRSDQELISQGLVNMVLPFFGAIPATAAIARSAVNIREGAKTRGAGMIHALFLLAILIFLGPIAQYIPKSFLAGILMVVSAKMVNIHELRTILHMSRSESLVMFITLGLTVFTDLVFAVEVGFVLAVFLVFVRLTSIINVSPMEEYDAQAGLNKRINDDPSLRGNVAVYTLHGPFFFGAMSLFEQKMHEHMRLDMPVIILRMKHVPFVDATAMVRLVDFIKTQQKRNSRVYLSGIRPEVRKQLMRNKELRQMLKHSKAYSQTSAVLAHIQEELGNTKS